MGPTSLCPGNEYNVTDASSSFLFLFLFLIMMEDVLDFPKD